MELCGLLETELLLRVDGLATVAGVGYRAYNKEGGERVESENLCADKDGGEKRVRGSTEDGCITEGRCKRERYAYDGRDDGPERSADGEQRGNFASLEPDRKRDDGKQQF